MGSTRRDRARLGIAGVIEGALPDCHARRPITVSVKIEGNPFSVTLADYSDFIVLRNLGQREFAIALPAPPGVIVDCGAHIGLSSLFFHALYPGASIYAVEPNPVTYRTLVLNTSGLGIFTCEAAVADADGSQELFGGPHSWDSSLTAGVGGARYTVQTFTLSSLLTDLGVEDVDLLKLDVEGAEFGLLRAAGPALAKVRAIAAELHFDLADSDEAEVRSLLSGFHVSFEPQRPGRAIMHAVRH